MTCSLSVLSDIREKEDLDAKKWRLESQFICVMHTAVEPLPHGYFTLKLSREKEAVARVLAALPTARGTGWVGPLSRRAPVSLISH